MAVGRACPLFDMKSKGGFSLEDATIGFATVADPATLIEGAKELDGAALGAASVRKAAEIAETPCEDMSCADVEAVAREMLEGVPGVGKPPPVFQPHSTPPPICPALLKASTE